MLSVVERSSPVNYDNAGEQSVQVVTPIVAVLAVVNTFIAALLAVAFITDTGISRTTCVSSISRQLNSSVSSSYDIYTIRKSIHLADSSTIVFI